MKNFKTKLTIALILNSLICLAFAKSPDAIIEGKKRAVFLITIRDKNNPKSRGVGGGFFTDNKGHFVTNLHIVEPYLQNPKNNLIQIQNIEGEEFKEVEILKCSNENKIDLCYGKIVSEKKIYFFDIVNRSPNKSQEFAIIGHNGDYFSVKKGNVVQQIVNVDEKYGVPLAEQDNRNTSMIQLGRYEYKNGSCKGDSGSPVFDIYTGDLFGIFTNCNGKKGEIRDKFAIDSKEIYKFINSDSKFLKFKIPSDHFYFKPIETRESKPARGEEFEIERKTGKLE